MIGAKTWFGKNIQKKNEEERKKVISNAGGGEKDGELSIWWNGDKP